jgi:hypothetical protein
MPETNRSCSDAFTVGDRVRVISDPSLRVRSTAGVSDATVLGSQPMGMNGTIIGGPAYASNYTWWQVDFDTAPDGWVIEKSGNKAYLVRCAHISDADCDGCVRQDEMMQYITKWKSGQATLAALMEAIGKWKNGCY